MKMDLKSGAAIASAVAMLLGASAPARADDKPAKSKTVHCAGLNECTGKGSCGSADNDCKGKNTCKGKGWTAKKTEKACKKAGGHVVAAK